MVGGITGLFSAAILLSLMIYINRLGRIMLRNEADRQALALSEDRYRAIFENSMDVISLKTTTGKFIDINPAGVRLFGYDSLDELLDIDIANDLYVNYGDWLIRQQRMENNGFIENYVIELKKKNGDHINVLETATAIYDDEGNISAYRSIMRDVTRQMQLETDLNQSQKLESIGRMAGGIAHDFNNYLTTISGQTEMAASQIPAGFPVRENLDEISRSIEKASGLTRQLLLFSRSQPFNMSPTDLNMRLGAARRQLSHALGESINVTVQADDQPCVVDIDTSALEQVLVSLALSSRRNMPDGGNIAVSTEHVTLDAEYALEHFEAYPGRFICINIKDDSNGMDAETVDHFFEPFFSVGSGQDGMVLAVAYTVIMEHGGWIEIKSAPGEGTTFRIFLPESEQEMRQAVSNDAGDQGRSERILLVEDEDAVRATIKKMLSDNGYEVITAANAEDAFDVFVSEKGDIQLVFSDVVLPGESGVELVEHLRSHNRTLPVVLSSGYMDKASDLDTIRHREYRFLQKPFSLPDLLEIVRSSLESPTPIS